MTAMLLTVAIFLFWGIVGTAVLALFPARLRIIQGYLVAPTVGLATTLLPVFLINRAGIPVRDFGLGLAIILALGSVAVLAWTRPVFPLRRLAPFAFVVAAALLLAAWPMLLYGFNWISFGNDDMANYALAAQRFLNNGFFAPFDVEAFKEGRDYSQAYWFMHVAGGVRPGSELMLAFVWAITGLNAHQVFMPVIAALHLALVTGGAALAAGYGKRRQTVTIAAVLGALSPLSTLGLLYQLIGQVGGMALLCVGIVLTYRITPSFKPRPLVLSVVPASLVLAALVTYYPELLPFFGIGWLGYIALVARKSRQNAARVALPAAMIAVIVLVLINLHAISLLEFMFAQAGGGLRAGDRSLSLFPYFLIPSGVPALWGFLPLVAAQVMEPLRSLAIVAGFVCTAWFLGVVLPSRLKVVEPSAVLAAAMSVLWIVLFARSNDFGLFKLSMYIQPFLAGTVATYLGRPRHLATRSGPVATRPYVQVAPIVVAAVLAITQVLYTLRSTGEGPGGLSEIPHASSEHLVDRLATLTTELSDDSDMRIVTDTPNIVHAKFAALATHERPLWFPSRDYFTGIQVMADNHEATDLAFRAMGADKAEAVDLAKRATQYRARSIGNFHFAELSATLSADDLLLEDTGDLINAYRNVSEYGTLSPIPPNHLVFVHSNIGNHYYLGDPRVISFYNLEHDPLFQGRYFAAFGKNMLFSVLRPTERPRLLLELTNTVTKNFKSELPKPIVQDTTMGFVGRGSARVFSEPLMLTELEGSTYLTLDMNRGPQQLPRQASGLMQLYGQDVPLDRRMITTFGRDISLVSDEEYQSLQPPLELHNFPQDLADPALEYSGIYEDGWISERSFFVLGKPSGELVIRGMIPDLGDDDFRTTLVVEVAGKRVEQALGLGEFTVQVPVAAGPAKQRVDLTFKTYQTLPGSDARPVGAKIDYIGFGG